MYIGKFIVMFIYSDDDFCGYPVYIDKKQMIRCHETLLINSIRPGENRVKYCGEKG
jgi:hypothetical protein